MWLTFGSIMMKHKHPTLPPLRTDRCMMTNNLTFPEYYNDTNSSSIFRYFDESPINATMTYFHPVNNQTIGVTSQCRNIITDVYKELAVSRINVYLLLSIGTFNHLTNPLSAKLSFQG